MKRSRYVVLLGMGASAVLLSACEDPNEIVPAKAYENVAACIADGFSEPVCTQAFHAAENSYEENYPKFADQYACEEEAGDGACEPDNPNSRNPSWRPAMIGFLMGAHAASRVQPQALVANTASATGRATAAGVPVAGNGANAGVPARAASAPTAAQVARAPTQSRGGFGSSAARVAGSGGASASSGG